MKLITFITFITINCFAHELTEREQLELKYITSDYCSSNEVIHDGGDPEFELEVFNDVCPCLNSSGDYPCKTEVSND